MDLQLNGKVALVTAASRGLGRAVAMEFAREGVIVAICSHSDLIDKTAEEIRKETGGEVLAVHCDLTKPSDIEKLISSTNKEFGQIDILFLNAGGPKPGAFLELSLEDWEIAVNQTLMSAVRLCYAVVPQMISKGAGSIVATQSYSIKQPIDHLVLSNSLRLAVIGLTKSLANELGPKGIRVNSINPTWTLTARVEELMRDRARRSGHSLENEITLLSKEIPLGRIGRVEEFGKTVAWLASPAASFIHGHALMFDGGAVKSAL